MSLSSLAFLIRALRSTNGTSPLRNAPNNTSSSCTTSGGLMPVLIDTANFSGISRNPNDCTLASNALSTFALYSLTMLS